MPQLFIDVEGRFAQFQDTLDQVSRNVSKSASSIQKAFSGIATSLGALGIGVSVASFVALAKSAIDAADNLGKLSQKIGITVEDLSGFKLAADLADVSMEDMTRGLKDFNKALVESRDPLSKSAGIFQALGVDTLKGGREALRQTAEAFKNLTDGELKSTAAGELFGRSGLNWIPLLNEGAAGLDKAAESAKNLGLVMSADFAKKAQEFNDNLKLLGTRSQTLGLQISSFLVGPLNTLTGKLVEGADKQNFWHTALRESIKLVTALGERLFIVPEALSKWVFQEEKLGSMLGARVGKITGPGGQPLQREVAGPPAPNAERLACTLSGGQWINDRCVRKTDKAVKDNTFENAKKSLENEISGLEEKTRLEKLLFDLEKGHIKPKSEAERQTLINLAKEFDLAKGVADQRKRDVELTKETVEEEAKSLQTQNDLRVTEGERLARNRAAVLDIADPIQKYRVEIEKVEELLDKGLISPEAAAAALLFWQEQVDAANGLTKEIKNVDNVSRDLGLVFSSALGKVITEGGKARDVFIGLAKDLQQLIVKMLIMEPLAKGLQTTFSGWFKGGGGGGSDTATWLQDLGLLGRASGGPVTAGGLHLVGERGPELFVPNTSGQIIPNNQLGGGSFNVSLNFGGGPPTDPQAVVAALMPVMRGIARGEIGNQLRPGGALT